jgi:Ubiquitin carboxyl-terminal hydrolase
VPRPIIGGVTETAFTNDRQNCFSNAVLSLCLNLPGFLESLSREAHGAAGIVVQKLLTYKKNPVGGTRDFLATMGAPFNDGSQHCALEFLSEVLSKLEDFMEEGTVMKTEKTFSICLHCNDSCISSVWLREPFLSLSCHESNFNLTTSITTFTENFEEQLHCCRCGDIRDHTSFRYLPSDGKNLMIKLDRVFLVDGRVCKNSSDVIIQEEIVSRLCMGKEQKLELTSFLIHCGESSFSGHWIAVVRDSASGRWISLDDIGGNKWYLTAHDAGLPQANNRGQLLQYENGTTFCIQKKYVFIKTTSAENISLYFEPQLHFFGLSMYA